MASQLKNDLSGARAWFLMTRHAGDNKRLGTSMRTTRSWYLLHATLWAGQSRGYRHSFAGSVRGRHRLYGNRQRDERTLSELEDYVREDEERSPLLQALQTCRRRRILRRAVSASTKLISKRSVRTVPVDSLSLLPRTRRGSPASKISTTYLRYRTNC
jgi:hypothetical protein